MNLLKKLNEQLKNLDITDIQKSEIIKLDTVENPGWTLSVNKMLIKDISIEKKHIFEDRGSGDLFYFDFNESILDFSGGAKNLVEIFEYLLKTILNQNTEERLPLINFMQNWYSNHCNEVWESDFGVKIFITEDLSWNVIFDLEETEMEEVSFNGLKIERNKDDWLNCYVKKMPQYEISSGKLIMEAMQFIGESGIENLEEVINIFKEWVDQNSDVDYNSESS